MNPPHPDAATVPCSARRIADSEGGEWRRTDGMWLPVRGWPEALSLAEVIASFGPVTVIDDEENING